MKREYYNTEKDWHVRFLDPEYYTDEYIIHFVTKQRKLTIEQDYYRHRAHIFKSIVFGKHSATISNEAWAIRLKCIGNFKHNFFKQLFWIIKVLFKKEGRGWH